MFKSNYYLDDNLCKYCDSSVELGYRYCNRLHAYLHYEIREKMNHLFTKITTCRDCENDELSHYKPNVITKVRELVLGHEFKAHNLCSFCNRDYLSHTPAARCEVCAKCGTCNVVDNLLLCDKCAEGIKSKHFDLIESSRSIDASLRGNQDFHNAATVPIIELKRAIKDDDSIKNKDEALKAELLIRYEHFCARLFDLNNEVYIAQLSKSIIRHNLDELASTMRAEERERIKIADSNYIPPAKKVVKAKIVAKDKKSVFDTMVENFAKMTGITETEARITMTQQMNKSGKKLP